MKGEHRLAFQFKGGTTLSSHIRKLGVCWNFLQVNMYFSVLIAFYIDKTWGNVHALQKCTEYVFCTDIL